MAAERGVVEKATYLFRKRMKSKTSQKHVLDTLPKMVSGEHQKSRMDESMGIVNL